MSARLELKKLSANEVCLQNAVTGRAREITFAMASVPCAFQFTAAAKDYYPTAGIKLRVGEHSVLIGFADMPPVSFFTKEFPELELDALDKDLRPVVFESITQPILEKLETLFGLSVRVEEVSLDKALSNDRLSNRLYFTLQRENESFQRVGHIDFGHDFQHLLLEHLPGEESFTDNAVCDQIEMVVKLILAKEEVSFNDWRSVEPNDLVLLDDLSAVKSGKYGVVLANKYIFEGNYKDGQVTLEKLMEETEEAFEDEEESFLEEDEASEPSEVSEPEEAFQDEPDKESEDDEEIAELNGKHKGIDALPVKLSFEVGQKKVKVGDLKTLQPGFTFKMDNPLDMPIVIRANGKKIGTGELVQVGDKIAVRISRFIKNV